MASTTIKDGYNGGSDNQALVDSAGNLHVTGSISATNPSVGTNGATAPTSATEVAGIDPSGNLHPLQTDSSGNLKIVGTLTVGEGFSNLSPGYPTQVSVGTTSVQIIAANMARKYFHLFNNSSQPIFIQYSSVAALNQGIKINSGTFFTLDSDNLWLGIVNAIGLIPGQLIDVLEGI